MSENNEDINKKIVILFKLFKNRPYHLAKYLLENNAFSKTFLNKISKSTKLSEISLQDEKINKYLSYNFKDIQQMEDFYTSLLDEIKEITTNKSKTEISKELNDKLDNYIRNEKFEEAAKLRDYMQKNSIKRNNKS